MNGIHGKTFGSRTLAAIGALTLTVVVTGSCTDDGVTTVDYAYDSPYLYTTYYPVDTAYSGYYWADSWNYYAFYYAGAEAAAGLANYGGLGGAAGGHGGAGATGTAGATGAGGMAGATGGSGTMTVRTTLASVVEALARGENVCPGQVTITPKTATPACAGGSSTEERNGVTLVFNGCVVSGATIDGTFDVISNRSASEQTCSSTTTITLGHTTTITNMSISDSNGKIVIPSQTDTGMTSYTFGQTPTSITFNTTGELQIFNNANTMQADLTYTGMDTVTLSGNSSYSVDGSTSVKEKNGPASATITKTGLTRSSGCCRPTAGSITVNRTGGPHAGQATWTFGPSCGTVMRNNVTATLPACI
jgi:hypothetical protein